MRMIVTGLLILTFYVAPISQKSIFWIFMTWVQALVLGLVHRSVDLL